MIPWRWPILVVALLLGASLLLPLDQLVEAMVTTMQEAGALGVALYSALYILASLLLIPGSLITLAAGMVYGPLYGLLVVSPVSTLAATLAFVLSKRLGRARLEATLSRYPRLGALDQAIARDAFRVVLLLRLSPLVPFNALNYALGLTRVRLGTYALASLIGMLPGTLLYTTLGASLPDLAALMAGEVRGEGPLSDLAWWLGLIATLLLTLWLAKVAKAALTDTLPREAKDLVAVFAKPPTEGEAKTRLSAALEPGARADLARAFLEDTLTLTRSLRWARQIVASTTEVPFDAAKTATWNQGTGDLGARVERILIGGLSQAERVYAVGTDAPGLRRDHLEEARDALKTHDAVLGPATDGGFYLLALTRCPEGLLAELPWSQPQTCDATEARLIAHGMRVRRLAPLSDIDRPEDLQALADEVESRPGALHHTRRALRAQRGLPRQISVIIPTLNEAQRIASHLEALRTLSDWHEVLVVDGGSDDGTQAIVAGLKGVTLIESPRGRGAQLNAGAAQATGDVLLFLHADVRLPEGVRAHIDETMATEGVLAGAFRTRTVCDDPESRRAWLMPLLTLGDLRPSYTRLPYGDQALFVDAGAFASAGGFPEQPLMEDLELSRRLSRLGRIRRVPARVEVSGRRYLKQPFRSVLIMNTFPLLYALGVSPKTLARWYAWVR